MPLTTHQKKPITRAMTIWLYIISSFSNISNIIQMSFPFVNKKSEFIIENRQRILGGGTRNLCTGAQNLPQKSLKIYTNLLITVQNYDKIVKTMIIPAAAGASLRHFSFALRFCTLAHTTSILHFTFALRCPQRLPQSAVLRHSLVNWCLALHD